MIYALMTQRESIDQYGGRIDSLEAEYVEYFARLGIQACPVSNYITNVLDFAEAGDYRMLILTGGGVVPPYAYDKEAERMPLPYRDQVEDMLLQWALIHHYPIIGICRGMQKLNSYFGGVVTKAEHVPSKRQVREEHPVILPESGATLSVNHFHGDVIQRHNLGEMLCPLAIDELFDTVEAFAHKEEKIIGVQWHPERTLHTDAAREYFEEMIKKWI